MISVKVIAISRRGTFGAFAVVLILAQLFAPTRAETAKIVVAVPTVSTSTMPFLIANKWGYYRKEGIETDLVYMNCSIAVKALIAHSVDVYACGSMTLVLAAVYNGSKLKGLMAFADKPTMEFIVGKDINSFEDLRGKLVSVGSRGSIGELFPLEALKANGLIAPKDVQVINSGVSSTRFAALLSGQVSGTILSPPWNFRALEQGFHSLGPLAKWVTSMQGGITVRQGDIEKREDLIYRFVRATLKGTIFYDKKRTESVKFMKEAMKLDSLSFAERVYDYESPLRTENALPSLGVLQAELKRAQTLLKEDKLLGIEETFDFSFVKKAAKELQDNHWIP